MRIRKRPALTNTEAQFHSKLTSNRVWASHLPPPKKNPQEMLSGYDNTMQSLKLSPQCFHIQCLAVHQKLSSMWQDKTIWLKTKRKQSQSTKTDPREMQIYDFCRLQLNMRNTLNKGTSWTYSREYWKPPLKRLMFIWTKNTVTEIKQAGCRSNLTTD